MIGRLRGLVVDKRGERVVLDVAGVGYEIAVPPRVLVELPGIGEEAVVHTHLHVREDVLALYGFSAEDQRELFRILLGVSGVGPKVALAVLGTMSPDDLRRAVVSEDAAALTAVPGIGKRSAQKLLLELRPKLELPDMELNTSGAPLAEVRSALEGLGYQSDEIRAVMVNLPESDELETLLRHALQELGRKS